MMVMDPATYFMGIKCYSCSGREIHIDYKAGDVICGLCGVVQSDRLIDQGNETNCYEEDEGRSSSRTSGLAESLGSSTLLFVAGSEKDRLVLERAQRAAASRKENVVLAHLAQINGLSARMNLSPAIKAKAAEIFQQVLLENIVRTAHKDSLAAACIYLACRVEGFPRLLDEVAEGCQVSLELLRRFQPLVVKRMGLPIGRISCADLVNRFGNKLAYPYAAIQLAYELCKKCVEYELLESSRPQYVAAAALLWAKLLLGWQRHGQCIVSKEYAQYITGQCYGTIDTTNMAYQAMRTSISMLLPLDMTLSSQVLQQSPKGLEHFPTKVVALSADWMSVLPSDGLNASPPSSLPAASSKPMMFRTPKGLKRIGSGDDWESGVKKTSRMA